MNISEKIAAIRREPQHVRLRYVWGCVAFSMMIILTLWFFSIAAMFKKGDSSADQNANNSTTSLQDQLKNIQQQAPSLKDLNNQQSPAASNEGIAPEQTANQNTTDFQYPTNDVSNQAPQSPAYGQQ